MTNFKAKERKRQGPGVDDESVSMYISQKLIIITALNTKQANLNTTLVWQRNSSGAGAGAS